MAFEEESRMACREADGQEVETNVEKVAKAC
jgi:hypothetical protein